MKFFPLYILAGFLLFLPAQANAATYQEIYAQCIENGGTNKACGELATSEINSNRFTTQPVTTNKYDPVLAPTTQSPTTRTTPAGNGQLSYIPLEPLPGTTRGGQTVSSLPALLSALFKLLITFGSLFAVVMLVVAGIGYMISEAAVDIEKAKERARAALWGLLLLTGCWLILYTVNPDLLKFNLNIPSSNVNSPSGGTAISTGSAAPTQTEQNNCAQNVGSIKINPDNSWTCVYQGSY